MTEPPYRSMYSARSRIWDRRYIPWAAEVIFVVDEVICYPVDYGFEETDIDILPVVIHVEGVDVLKLVLHLLLHAGILGQENPYIKIPLVQILGERSDNVCQSSRFDERHPLRCNKQNFLHGL